MNNSSGSVFSGLLIVWLCLSPFVVAGIGYLAYWFARSSRRVSEELAEANRVAQLRETDSQAAHREDWLKQIGSLSFANETEVEIKFVYPLLLQLGYNNDEFNVRYKTSIQAGREVLQKEADWVIWRRGSGHTRAIMVIEAKAPGVLLDGLVQGQGRSYAIAVSAPYYILTNGGELTVYMRGVETDKLALWTQVGELGDRWDELARLVGAGVELARESSIQGEK